MLPVRQRSRRARHKSLLQPSLTSVVSHNTTLVTSCAVLPLTQRCWLVAQCRCVGERHECFRYTVIRKSARHHEAWCDTAWVSSVLYAFVITNGRLITGQPPPQAGFRKLRLLGSSKAWKFGSRHTASLCSSSPLCPSSRCGSCLTTPWGGYLICSLWPSNQLQCRLSEGGCPLAYCLFSLLDGSIALSKCSSG